MTSSSTWAQDVITCDLCDNPTQQFYRRERLVFSSCASHPNQKCEGHCQQCDVPVCFRCLTGPHSGHTVKDMSEIVQQMKEEIKKETEEIEKFISRFALTGADIDQKISNLTEKFKTMEREGENLRKSWHEEVDSIFDTLQSTISKMKDRRLTTLRSHQSRLQDSGTKLARITKENKKILKSNKVSDVTSYKSELKEFRDIPTDVDVKIPSLNSNTVQGRELSIELEEFKATLTQISLSSLTDEVSILSVRKLLEKAKVIASIPSGIKPLGALVCTGTNETWAYGGDKFIRCIDIKGSLKEKITTECEPYPGDISVTRQGELIYSDSNSRTVNIVRRGRTETLITLPKGWHPLGLCCTRSGDLLVSMCIHDRSHHKIVRFQRQTAIQEIYKNDRGQNVFQGGKAGVCVEENNNGDICASDLGADTVIVMDKTGKVRFRYDGTPARRNNPFHPQIIATDSLSQIIITDFNNDCLHILDQKGQFLRCIDNCGLLSPGGLSVDSEGRLWVGCCFSGDIKVIQYME
ncbi:uncharacterized protein LOC134241935 [Saccostrea cucullata]|uniref:uncharacterized protein LOC134241935 n=1 Tax=Saccostrea cuccullata TaxID=36930 RepID=UPI002ED213A3